jgi:hypothetical protein
LRFRNDIRRSQIESNRQLKALQEVSYETAVKLNALQELSSETADKLKALIDIVDKTIRRNGKTGG